MVLAMGNSLAQCHEKLKDMMECPNGGFDWSLTHNSPFELSETVLMNFSRSYRDTIPGPLRLDKPNADGSTTSSLTNPVSSYKYLGVIIDPKLHWSLQHKKAVAAATYWASRIGQLSKSASGLSTSGTKQLYNTVAVPRFTYGAEVWYTPLHKPSGSQKTKGSVSVSNKLKSAQRKVAVAIVGGLRTMAGDVLDVHAYILRIDLLLNKILYRAALRLCSLPKSHTLYAQVHSRSTHRAKRHLSPVHNLLRFANLNPKQVETISPVRRSPGYKKPFRLIIPPSKDAALPLAQLTDNTVPVRVYSDGSGFEGGIGASAILYLKNRLMKSIRFFLGSDQEHTVYKAEGVGLIMGLHLLSTLHSRFIHPTVLGSDSQAVIRALDNQWSHPSQYIIDEIHQSAENLHRKQDGLINRAERELATSEGKDWIGRPKGVINLQVHWVPGHVGFAPNEKADEEAKKAAQGHSSEAKYLPKFLRKPLPLSVSALRQNNMTKIKKHWEHRWKSSPREDILKSIDSSAPSKKYLCLIAGLDRRQASLLFQLRSGHIGLNQHLFHIRKSDTPVCPNCQGITVESVKHFLVDWPFNR